MTRTLLLALLVAGQGACAAPASGIRPAEPVDFYVTVDPAAQKFDADTVDRVSFIAPPRYLDACPATPTPLPPAQPTARRRAREIARASLRWPRELCRCLLEARGASAFVRGPEELSFSMLVAGSSRPRVPERVSFEGESPSQPCLERYLEDRPVSAGPGPLRIGFKVEIHESLELRRVHDVLRSVRLELKRCFAGAPRPHGTIDVRWVIDEDGKATEVDVPESSEPGTCVATILERLRFPTCRGCIARFEVLPP